MIIDPERQNYPQPKSTLTCLITATFHYDSLIDNRRFLPPCGLNFYFLHKLKATVNE
jgi:hypothetical protein